MDSDSDAVPAAEKSEPASINSHEDADEMNSHISRDCTSSAADVAMARWTLLRQVQSIVKHLSKQLE